MANPSLFRSLPAPRRVALLTKLFSESKETRAHFVARMARRGGFRAATLILWPPAKLAQEVVRLNVQTPEDELDLLQALYVDVEPQIQADFLAAAGVQAAGAVIPEGLEPPYATAEGVAKGAAAIREKHGADAEHYLRVIARYNAAAWPGVESLLGADPA